MRYKATDEETVAYFSTIAAATKQPIMIYNNPVDYKIEVTLEMFAALEPHKNITAVKDSTRDITNITRMINRFGDRFLYFMWSRHDSYGGPTYGSQRLGCRIGRCIP